MSSALKGIATAFSIFLFFCLMSRIDFLIHRTLYDHGLRFSYEWAVDYWAMYTATFVVFSVITSLMYWLGSEKTIKDMRFSVALLATVNILMIGGIQDVMFYVFWAGGLPANDIIWWWAPWNYVFGTWTSPLQIVLASLSISATMLLWLRVTAKSTP